MRFAVNRLWWWGWWVSAAAGSQVFAQDTRTVTEPAIPASCTVLPAMLQSVGDKVDAADEQKLDTARIQAAMDKCKPGMAVELKQQSGKNAFLTGPLELRTGVTLLIDEGVTLFGSRDPKVYEFPNAGWDAGGDDRVRHEQAAAVEFRLGRRRRLPLRLPAARPAGPPRRGGCRPLISATQCDRMRRLWATGRSTGAGYAKLLGKDFSWWEMARKAEPKDDIVFFDAADRRQSCGRPGDVPDYAA